MLQVINKEKISYYIGFTGDLTKRIEQHKSGKGARYTKGNKIITLVYTEKHASRSSAMKREKELKKMKKDEKIELAKNYSSLPINFFEAD